MPPIFHPLLGEHDKFSTPMNGGERRIRDLLNEKLDETWHVFVQPHLLNQQPDFMIASLRHGVTVIEVKDWQDGGHRCREPRILEVRDTMGDWVRTSEDPILQVFNYKKGVAERFLIPPGAIDDERTLFGRVNAVVVLPQSSGGKSQVMLKKSSRLEAKNQRFIKVVGREVFTDSNAFQNLIHGVGNADRAIDSAVFERFINRVSEPEAVAEQREPLKLSREARRIVNNPDRSIIRRVKGPAGSGKTLGLASRAALLAAENKSVLILTFNITLAHYVAALVGRETRRLSADRRKIDCIHIHGFCSDILKKFDIDHLAVVDSNGDVNDFDQIFRKAEAVYESGYPGLPKYDAIFVDEGQDYKPEWWNFIRHHLRNSETSELLLAVDVSQDLYGRRAWTEEKSMEKAGFNGQWAQLVGSYRLPVDYVPIAIDFAKKFVVGEVDLPSIPTDHDGKSVSPTERHWINAIDVADREIGEIVSSEAQRLGSLKNGPHEADIIILTETHAVGLEIMNRINANGVLTEHIFTKVDGDERRNRKTRFWPGVAMLKGSTVHSFKGWEGRAIIFILEDTHPNVDLGRLAYTAITRVKGDPKQRSAHITIVNRLPGFKSYKEVFEREITSAEVPQLAGAVEFEF